MPELMRRYIVMAMATEGPFDVKDPEAPFVLKPWKDPAALSALEAYRDACYPELARELSLWIKTIRSGPVVRGDIGAKNEAHLASRRPPAVKGKARKKAAVRPRKKGRRR